MRCLCFSTIKTLGESDSEDDAAAWVKKSRQKQKEKELAEKRVIMLPQSQHLYKWGIVCVLLYFHKVSEKGMHTVILHYRSIVIRSVLFLESWSLITCITGYLAIYWIDINKSMCNMSEIVVSLSNCGRNVEFLQISYKCIYVYIR